MLESAHQLIRSVGQRLGLSQDEINYLLTPNARHEFEIKLSNGRTHKAYRVQHNNTLGPYKGGIRFHPEVDLDEVEALATLMSLKTAAVGLPLGGGKGGVTVDAKQLTKSELEELSRQYVAGLSKHIGPDKDIPAPDVNTNATVMDWMVDEFTKTTGDTSLASFTGKSIDNGGSEGRESATGRGGIIVLNELLSLLGRQNQPLKLVIQGFGNVGSFFGLIAEQENTNWQLVAATDSSGGIYNPSGLSAKQLDEYKQAGGKLRQYESESAQVITNEDLVALPVHVLVLAALGDVINGKNVDTVQASIIIELANGPVSQVAYEQLRNAAIVVPDVLANAGGVIVSYLEWQQNKSGEHWSETKVNQQLTEYLVRATREIYNYAQANQLDLKTAAFEIAVKRLLGARPK